MLGDRAPMIAETHVGMVVLVGDRAYKSKKPVRTAFLDFSTPDRRAAALRRELELNRRISPDVYLGLGRFSGPDQPDETVLVMRRTLMPADRRMATLVMTGAPVVGTSSRSGPAVAAFPTRTGAPVMTSVANRRSAGMRRITSTVSSGWSGPENRPRPRYTSGEILRLSSSSRRRAAARRSGVEKSRNAVRTGFLDL